MKVASTENVNIQRWFLFHYAQSPLCNHKPKIKLLDIGK